MSRKHHNSSTLARFRVNGNELAPSGFEQLHASEKKLVAALSFCLLCCRDHIAHAQCAPVINLVYLDAEPGWEVENWNGLHEGLRQALTKVFVSNTTLPPMYARTAA